MIVGIPVAPQPHGAGGEVGRTGVIKRGGRQVDRFPGLHLVQHRPGGEDPAVDRDRSLQAREDGGEARHLRGRGNRRGNPAPVAAGHVLLDRSGGDAVGPGGDAQAAVAAGADEPVEVLGGRSRKLPAREFVPGRERRGGPAGFARDPLGALHAVGEAPGPFGHLAAALVRQPEGPGGAVAADLAQKRVAEQALDGRGDGEGADLLGERVLLQQDVRHAHLAQQGELVGAEFAVIDRHERLPDLVDVVVGDGRRVAVDHAEAVGERVVFVDGRPRGVAGPERDDERAGGGVLRGVGGDRGPGGVFILQPAEGGVDLRAEVDEQAEDRRGAERGFGAGAQRQRGAHQ